MMLDAWINDPDFCDHVSKLAIEDDDHSEAELCICYGRGKTREQMVLPRLPKSNVLIDKMNKFVVPSSYRRPRGKGRGLLRSKQAPPSCVGLVVRSIEARDASDEDKHSLHSSSSKSFVYGSSSSLDSIDSTTPITTSTNLTISSSSSNHPAIVKPTSTTCRTSTTATDVTSTTCRTSPTATDVTFTTCRTSTTATSVTIVNTELRETNSGDAKNEAVPPWGSWGRNDSIQGKFGLVETDYGEYRPPQRKPTTLDAFIPISPTRKKKKNKKKDRSSEDHTSSEIVESKSLEAPSSSDSLSVTEACALTGAWHLGGSFVVQMNNVPCDCDITVLHDIVSSYGMVKELEVMQLGSSSSVRFQLDSTETCNWVVECLNNTECIFPNVLNKPLECFCVEQAPSP